MAGTKIGGLKAKEKNLKSDPDFYKKIGAVGGKLGRTGGFAQGKAGRERARKYGKIGGTISRRRPTEKIEFDANYIATTRFIATRKDESN